MATWNYTKKIIVTHISVDGRVAHENAFADLNGPQDWYYDQIDAGLADPSRPFVPLMLVSDTVYELLVTDQAQADSFLATTYAAAEKIGYPLNGTVIDVVYTSETIPWEFNDYTAGYTGQDLPYPVKQR